MNIEQGKELNYTSLEKIIGKVPKTLRTQRASLNEAATKENTDRVLQFNAGLLDVKGQRDFYYDPHTKHYTGHLKILSTWCPSIRLADKGINMDYVHTTSGYPVYFSTDDNFYDLRERFASNTKAFRSLFGFGTGPALTWVIDRGIYSLEVFKSTIESPDTHIITWEKGYEKDKWREKDDYGKGSLVKKRNNHKDLKLVHYHYQDRPWDKHPAMRQIIVRILNNKWEVLIEVSILTDDKNRAADQVIGLMFNRWVQENDFKYLIDHFGINQITSYAFTDYKALRDKIEDKTYTCQQHKSLTKEIKRVRDKLKTALLQKHKFTQNHGDAPGKLSPGQEKRKTKIQQKIDELNTQLSALEQERGNTTKHVSKLDELIEQDYKKLDTNTKNFMDAIKILGRNIFYLSFQSFKEKYDNFRDDHLLFRHLTRSAGTIEPGPSMLNIALSPQMEYQPKVKKIITRVLDEINQGQPQILDGSNAKIKLFLKT